MENNWKNCKELIEYPKSGILSKVIHKDEINNVTLFCMAKGVDMTEHTSTKEGFVYVIEGDGVFNLEGNDIEMKAGVLIYMKNNAKHAIKANENTTFILFLK